MAFLRLHDATAGTPMNVNAEAIRSVFPHDKEGCVVEFREQWTEVRREGDSVQRFQRSRWHCRETLLEITTALMRTYIPPSAMSRVVQRFQHGDQKHAIDHWTLQFQQGPIAAGLMLKNRLGNMQEHLQRLLAGDTSEDHMAAVIWWLVVAMHAETLFRSSVTQLMSGADEAVTDGPKIVRPN